MISGHRTLMRIFPTRFIRKTSTAASPSVWWRWKKKMKTKFSHHFCVRHLYKLQDRLKGGVSRILQKNKILTYTKAFLLSHHLCASRNVRWWLWGDTPPSAWILMFWFLRDLSGWGVGVSPPANDSTQLRLRAPAFCWTGRCQTRG